MYVDRNKTSKDYLLSERECTMYNKQNDWIKMSYGEAMVKIRSVKSIYDAVQCGKHLSSLGGRAVDS